MNRKLIFEYLRIAMFLLIVITDIEAQTDFVYVESNRADRNSILAYRNDSGRLTGIGEFPTGGKGLFDLSLKLGLFDSDQDIITNAEGTVLYAVNSGSDSISAFHITTNGGLRSLPGSPYSSAGFNPVSIAIARDTLVVVNKSMDPSRPSLKEPKYVSFALAPDGSLESGPLSTTLAPPDSSPTQADVSSGQRLVVDAQFLGGHLQSFLIAHDGSLVAQDFQALPSSEFVGSSAPHLPLGLWSHPHRPFLYVGFVTINRLGVYKISSSGHLKFVRTVPDSGAAICWLRTNREGTRLYTANTGDNSISVYDLTDPLTPREIQHLKLKGLGNVFQITLDPTENYLYAVTQRADTSIPLGEGNTLHVLSIHKESGKVTEAGSTFVKLPVPAGARPQGIAAVRTR